VTQAGRKFRRQTTDQPIVRLRNLPGNARLAADGMRLLMAVNAAPVPASLAVVPLFERVG
jgi:hypothetical protein